jgi:hypothetical protein
VRTMTACAAVFFMVLLSRHHFMTSWEEGSKDGLEGSSTARSVLRADQGCPCPPGGDGQMLGRKTDLTYHERSDVRVGHDRFDKLTAGRFGVVVPTSPRFRRASGESVIQPGIGDRLPRRSGGWRHPHALLPQA